MEVFGNIEALKGAIEKKYSSKIKEIEKQEEKQLEEIDKELKKKLGLLKSHMKTATDAAVKKTYSMILSSEKLKAKKEFEEKRESLIEAVFEEAKEKAKDIVHTQEYIDYVKKNMPKEKGIVVTGDSDYYQKFFPDIKINKNNVGIRFEAKGVIYDFTLDNIINSKKDILRHEVSKVLFG
jgi:vacuolar-type H+-ATPase subunit E/Vma4